MRDDLATPPVTDTLNMAIGQRKPDPMIHHSDRASQYSPKAFKTRREAAAIAVSMGHRGDAYDNAAAHSFFAPLETELLDRTGFANSNQARSAAFHYIEGFYNPHQRHPTIGYHSPADYKRREPNYPVDNKTRSVQKSGATPVDTHNMAGALPDRLLGTAGPQQLERLAAGIVAKDLGDIAEFDFGQNLFLFAGLIRSPRSGRQARRDVSRQS